MNNSLELSNILLTGTNIIPSQNKTRVRKCILTHYSIAFHFPICTVPFCTQGPSSLSKFNIIESSKWNGINKNLLWKLFLNALSNCHYVLPVVPALTSVTFLHTKELLLQTYFPVCECSRLVCHAYSFLFVSCYVQEIYFRILV